MVQIREQEEEEEEEEDVSEAVEPSSKHSTMAMASSSSLPPCHPNPNPNHPHSPDTPSSISSDHTFHGFSPNKESVRSPDPTPPAPVVANRLVQDQLPAITKTESNAETGRRKEKPQLPVLMRANREKFLKRAGLALRFCEFVVCLVSFSVMAADKNRGWAIDSFDRYIEFRYSMSVNVIGFAYSGLQGLDLLHQLTMGKDLLRSQLRCYFDFAIDQILAYLLLSASSSAYTRVDDWISNWGKDKFPTMASASVGVSFLAFVAFALSSLISGYTLCTRRFT